MKLTVRTKLRIGTFATAGMVPIFVMTILFLISAISRAQEGQKIAEEIVRLSFHSSLLRGEYVQFPSERAKAQWISLHESRLRLLQENKKYFASESQQMLFDDLARSIEASKHSFESLVRLIEAEGDPTVIQELSNQMNMRSQENTILVLRLSDLSREYALQAVHALVVISFLIGMILFGISLASGFISGKIARSIQVLEKGTMIVASGDLSYRLPIDTDGEFASVAQSFNRMTKKVAVAQKDLEDRVAERTADLQKTNVFLDAIIENIPNMIFLKDAKDLRFVRFNKAGEELIGYQRQALLTKNDFDLFPKDQAEFFVKKDRDVLRGKKLVDVPEEPIQTKDKGTRILHTKKLPLLDAKGKPAYLLGISEDITEKKKALEDIQKFQQAVAASTDGIIITDPQTRIIYVNPAWSRLTGYSSAEVLGKKTSILKTGKTDEKVLKAIRHAIQNGQPFQSDEFVNRRKDGTEYNAELTVYPVRKEKDGEEEMSPDKILFFVGIHADVTERKQSDRAKSEFVSLASHQLRTPLTEVRWALSSLREDKLTREQAKKVDTAHKASSHMAETIKAMLTVAHIETGEINPEPLNIVLRESIDDVVELHNVLRGTKKITLDIDCPQSARIRTDEQLFKEIFSNVLLNAYKYTPVKGKVHILVTEEPDGTRIDVRDTGCGIPHHEQKKVSEKFFRASNAIDSDQEGSGLGLYMVYSLMKLLGGEISFVSEEQKGSTFTLLFPRSS